MDENLFSDIPQERPFECNECKKAIKVLYTEVVGDAITNTVMCNDCPELQKRMHGLSKQEIAAKNSPMEGLCCGDCGTTLEEIKTGHPLGCPTCYEVFQEVVFQDLVKDGRVPKQLTQLKPQETLHLGKMPVNKEHLSPSGRLIALNEALQATLDKEDYEQAALIRDQIKHLTENQHGK